MKYFWRLKTIAGGCFFDVTQSGVGETEAEVVKRWTAVIVNSQNHIDSVPTIIHGVSVEIIQTYKYLGTVFDDR